MHGKMRMTMSDAYSTKRFKDKQNHGDRASLYGLKPSLGSRGKTRMSSVELEAPKAGVVFVFHTITFTGFFLLLFECDSLLHLLILK